MRNLDITSVNRLEIPVTSFVTKEGAQVLLPAGPFSDVIEDVYPDFTAGT
jgi:hypothetical protein